MNSELFDKYIVFQSERDSLCARSWFKLSVLSLICAGLLSLLLILARTPLFTPLVTDPHFFKRCLVVHVNLALSVWVYSFIAFLFYAFLPGTENGLKGIFGFFISASGVVMMILSAYIPGAKPVLSNYIPVIEHPVYLTGFSFFAIGLLISFVDNRLIKKVEGEFKAFRTAIKVSVIFFILAMEILIVAYINAPDLFSVNYFEVLFWGAGHILQFSSEAAKISVWILLITLLTKENKFFHRSAFILIILFLLPALILTPILMTFNPTDTFYRTYFTGLMRWAIFPFVTMFLLLCIYTLAKYKIRKLEYTDIRVSGFAMSALLTVAGFIFGALIKGPNTMVPAHYHASIGSVTVSFMAVSYILLEKIGYKFPEERYSKFIPIQPIIFGSGQLIFALGFAVAGAQGQGRKIFGAEQYVKGIMDYIGLTLMGVGGMIAIVGGVLFLIIIARSLIIGVQDGFILNRYKTLEVTYGK